MVQLCLVFLLCIVTNLGMYFTHLGTRRNISNILHILLQILFSMVRLASISNSTKLFKMHFKS